MNNINLNEFWIDCCENPSLYEVSNFGKIKSKKRKKPLNPYLNDDGYLVIMIKDSNNKRVKKRVHRLVYYSFHPHAQKNHDIHHIDKNKTNNEISNLQDLSKEAHAKIEQNLIKYGLATQRGKNHSAFKSTIAGFCSLTGELKYVFNGHAEIKASEFCDSYVYKATKTGKKYSKHYNLIFKKIYDDSNLKIGNIYEIEFQNNQDRIIAIDMESQKVTHIFIGSKEINESNFSSRPVYDITNGKIKTHKNHTFIRVFDNQLIEIGKPYDPNKKINPNI